MYVPRTLEPAIVRASQQFPVVLLTGARQVGKTTLLRQLSQDGRAYVTLDDPLVLSLAKSDPALFMQRFPPPVLIDEIQYAPELLPYIKIAADRAGQTGLFWLTGSQQFASTCTCACRRSCRRRCGGSIRVVGGPRGRAASARLVAPRTAGHGPAAAPLCPHQPSWPTGAASAARSPCRSCIGSSGAGRCRRSPSNAAVERDLFYSSYVLTYLQHDVHALARVGDELAFLRFLRATAARTGQLLNLADLARDADVAPNTAKNWLSILQTAEIVYLLEPYPRS